MGAPKPLDLDDLKAVSVLGRGAKGIVFLVVTRDGRTFALKVMSKPNSDCKNDGKNDAVTGNNYRRMWIEKDVLSILKFPLLPSLHGLVSTDHIVGFAMDRCSGGNLSMLRRKQAEKMSCEVIIRFYAAELVLVLEHLHSLGIVYRDLKPENIMIQDSGHLMLVDFDLATKLTPQNSPDRIPNSKPHRRRCRHPSKFKSFFSCNSLFLSESVVNKDSSCNPSSHSTASSTTTIPPSSSTKSNSFVGTEEYVAPEVIKGTGHDFAVDWWSLGIVLHEMLYSRTPFRGQNRKDTFCNIVTKPLEMTGEKTALHDLIRRLLEKDKNNRIRVEAIKSHDFFRHLDWDSILEISRPPFIPAEECDGDGLPGKEEIDVEKFVKGVYAKVPTDGNGGDICKKHVGVAVLSNNVRRSKGESLDDDEDDESSTVSEFLIF